MNVPLTFIFIHLSQRHDFSNDVYSGTRTRQESLQSRKLSLWREITAISEQWSNQFSMDKNKSCPTFVFLISRSCYTEIYIRRGEKDDCKFCFMPTLKEQFNQKWKFCNHLLTLMSFQIYMTLILLWNSKDLLDFSFYGRKKLLRQNILFLTEDINVCRFGTTWG